MSELRSSLLEKKKLDTFEKYYEDCLHRIKRIKQKNDTLQKNTGTDLEDEIAVEVKKQKEFMETEIKELKDQIDEIEKKYRDPEAKNKMKTIKKEVSQWLTQAQKQIERNRQILREFINKSFLIVENVRKTRGEGEDDDQGKYFEGGRAQVNEDAQGINQSVKASNHVNGSSRHQQQVHKESELEIDYEIEHKIAEEKTTLLNQVEQDAMRINNIINDIGVMVNEQGDNLNIISEQTLKANKNVVEANAHIDEANTLQKKSRKKTIWLVALIVLIVGVVIGIVFIVK